MIRTFIVIALSFLLIDLNTICSAADGRQLYLEHCATCHGIGGEGAKGPSLNKQGLLAIASEDYFIKSIHYGRPTSGCPSFINRLKGEEIKSIAAFIKKWQTADSVSVPGHTVEPRESEKGKKIFLVCVGCHDVGGVGAMGPSLIDPGFQASASDGFLRGTIMYGREGTPMRGYIKGQGNVPELSEQEIDEVIAYIRYLGLKRP